MADTIMTEFTLVYNAKLEELEKELHTLRAELKEKTETEAQPRDPRDAGKDFILAVLLIYFIYVNATDWADEVTSLSVQWWFGKYLPIIGGIWQ